MRIIDILKDIWSCFDFSYLISILISVIPSLFCISFHEFSHGLVAHWLGDDTAKNAGRLTLNPIKSLDITGLLMLIIFHVGWAKPVPVNMYKFKNPKRGMALTALAGPLSNMLLAVVFIFLYGFFYVPCGESKLGEYVSEMLILGGYMSIGLAIFNLIPVPPLDGSKVLFSFLSNEKYYKLMRYEKYFSVIMIVLVATGLIGKPLSRAIYDTLNALTPVADSACSLYLKLFR